MLIAARSPVFTHLNATIQGLSTIRAFSAQSLVREEFDNHQVGFMVLDPHSVISITTNPTYPLWLQNLHTSAWSMFLFSSTSFGVTLDLMSLCFSFVVIFSFLLIDQCTRPVTV